MSLINIITITDGKILPLRQTLKSIDKQNFKDYKNLIISKSKIKNINKKFKKKNRLFIVKEGSSIYEAMNYGLKKSKNKYLIFLNSGDLFYSESALKNIYKYRKKFKIKSCFMFITILKNKNDYFIPKKKIFFSSHFLTHSSFIRPSSKKDNGFDIKKMVTADGDWMKKNVKKFKIKKIYKPLTIFNLGGISNYPSLRSLRMKTNNGFFSILKESIKLMLLKIVGGNFFYKIIYYFKYDKINYNKIRKL